MQREHQVTERMRERKGKQAAERQSFCLSSFVSILKENKPIRLVFVRLFIFQLLSFGCRCCCYRCLSSFLSFSLYALIGNKSRIERVLNFNKYVHFDSFAFQLFALLSVCVCVVFISANISFVFISFFPLSSYLVAIELYARCQRTTLHKAKQ